MKNKSTSYSAFLTLRALLGVLCATACSILIGTPPSVSPARSFSTFSQRTLTFADRVAYQRAIEDVYWHHRIWPKERSDPKPSLDAVMSHAQLERKVTDYLRKSQALEDYWQRPITAEQLQAEMERMAKHTRQPEVLSELFAALGNDPLVIAECLARPALAERLLTSRYAYDQRIHGELKQRADAELQASRGSGIDQIRQLTGTYSEIQLVKNNSSNNQANHSREHTVNLDGREWEETVRKIASTFQSAVMSVQPDDVGPEPYETIPVGTLSPLQEDESHYYTIGVVSKTKDHLQLAVISWLKEPLDFWLRRAETLAVDVTIAGRNTYTIPALPEVVNGCINDTWTNTSLANAPSARYAHTAVWTGSEMIIWGGQDSSFVRVNTGGRYNLATDVWTATGTANAPSGRQFHTAVWTGTEMIVWGGEDNTSVRTNTGGKYNPSSNTWTSTSAINAPVARALHTAVWTGNEMIVWGGQGESSIFNTGGKYNPTTNSWTATSTTNAPAARVHHTAVWTGNEMTIWGGVTNNVLNTGGGYNPVTNSWRAVSTANAPAAREGHTAVWSGTEMIIWGGVDDNYVSFRTGGRWDPDTNTWVVTSTTNTPIGRVFDSAIWTSNEMIVWGGLSTNCGYSCLDTGGRYNPGADTWIATGTMNAPAARNYHTAVWADNEMIVWGGLLEPDTSVTNTGGRYCASGTTATPTPTPSPTATPVSITVTNTNDSGPGSLRNAIAIANDGDTINFSVTGNITLTSGELLVNHSITISGPGDSSLAVSGNGMSRVFHIGFGTTVTIFGLTITRGHVDFGNQGGGIYSDHAILTITSCTINLSNAGSGGAIYSDGSCEGTATLNVYDSRIINNVAFDGGGICSDGYGGSAMLHLNNSSVSSNVTQQGGNGSGINNVGERGSATAEINNSTINNNSGALNGGGIHNDGSTGHAILRLSNSTVSYNSAGGVGVGGGGAIYNDGSYGNATAEVSDSTLSGNSSAFIGGTIHNYGSSGTATLEVHDTILKRGTSGENIRNQFGTVITHGYNVSNDDASGYFNGPGDQINTDPMLGPLQNNGGPTFTHELLPGSPAIDAGDPNFAPPPFYDQRGPNFFRVRNGRIDIGSFEVQSGSTPTPTPTAMPTITPTPMATPTPTPIATASPTGTPTATVTATATSTPKPISTPRPRPTPPPRPTLPPHITPVPPPPSPRPTAWPRPTPPPHITPAPPPSSPRPTPPPRP